MVDPVVKSADLPAIVAVIVTMAVLPVTMLPYWSWIMADIAGRS